MINTHHATGPRAEAGKARSAQNARTHGLTAKELVIAPEDSAEFEELLADYQSEIDPQGAIEHTLFDELVSAAWNLRRIRRMETELCAAAASYSELLENEAIQKKLDRLARHKTRIERTFHRSLRELKALQTNTALVPLLPRPIAEISPALASASEISKRSRRVPDRLARQNPHRGAREIRGAASSSRLRLCGRSPTRNKKRETRHERT